MLLLGWESGQESPIHDHAGQSCWMAVLDGELEELHFESGAPEQPLVAGRTKTFSTGQVAFIDDEIALHLIRPRVGQRGVSLHLYAKAIDACRIFDPETGTASEAQLTYHSVRGELCSQSPEAVRAEWA
jgi:cysteine dioxygenase